MTATYVSPRQTNFQNHFMVGRTEEGMGWVIKEGDIEGTIRGHSAQFPPSRCLGRRAATSFA